MPAEQSPPSSFPGTGHGPIHRLVRTLSGRGHTSQPISPVLSPEVIPPSTAESEAQETPESTESIEVQAAPVSRQKTLLEGVLDRFTGFNFSGKSKSPDDSNDSNELEEATIESTTDTPTSSTPPVELATASSEPPEPTYIARKIQALLDALPSPSPRPVPPPKQPKSPARDGKGRPIPPAGATPIKDSRFIALLSSATIMNGGRAGDEAKRVSVWSVLESMEAPRHEDGSAGGGGDSRDDDGSGGEGDGFSDGSSLMMYSPLLPTTSSLVELAESEYVAPPPVEEGPSVQETSQAAGWMGMWPFSVWGSSARPQEEETPGSVPILTSPLPSIEEALAAEPASPRRRSSQMRVQGQRVWVPSTTQLSLQALWWGYRIFLPPPVLDILSDKQLEASKRAAMITTALTWFFSHLPITSLPPAVRPALMLLQTLVPFVGYIGTFISWSWSTVKSYDTGHGVILTATWLLPVALIPGTWDERDFPVSSPPPQSPVPLPPVQDPTPSPVQAPAPVPGTPSTPTSPPCQQPPATPAPTTPAPPPTPAPIPPPPPTPATPAPTQPQPQPAPTQPTTPTRLPELQPQPVVLVASEPLPPWVPPPPPPSPPKIPLPEIDEVDEGEEKTRFGFGVLGRGKAKDGKDKVKAKGRDREGRKDKDKSKRRLKVMAMATLAFGGGSRSVA
ncbi:hypothetical protein Hypma_003051 [Hypsizygus marmoreus]|uniref:Uncharacterized protein n=1 Tax=Hypsizygus marmoreus TaxID=39966 RepID=A0A369J4K4_HYPMA|nr:hypothetical protein Hypma_003051 [Hypsizygus marmoreus]